MTEAVPNIELRDSAEPPCVDCPVWKFGLIQAEKNKDKKPREYFESLLKAPLQRTDRDKLWMLGAGNMVESAMGSGYALTLDGEGCDSPKRRLYRDADKNVRLGKVCRGRVVVINEIGED